MEVISQLWKTAGILGVWKGTNVTFVYGILQSTIELWAGSALAALFQVADPASGIEIEFGTFPMASLGIAVAAATISGIILAPIDIVRTRSVPSLPELTRHLC
jgi:fusion and transport protein UGO1